MPLTLNLPDIRTALARLDKRIGILERRTRREEPAVDDTREILFSYAGDLATGTSPPVRVRQGGILGVLAVTLGTAGSTGTDIDVLRNGTIVATVTVPASTEIYDGDVLARFAADSDTLALEITTAGTGAADMTAAARFT